MTYKKGWWASGQDIPYNGNDFYVVGICPKCKGCSWFPPKTLGDPPMPGSKPCPSPCRDGMVVMPCKTVDELREYAKDPTRPAKAKRFSL